jgi:4-hydroxy-3-polyprenylbenzoate decarboxylase
MKVIVGMCGASGIQYGIDVLKALREAGVETYLVMSEWAEKVIAEETGMKPDEIKKLATRTFDNRDMAAAISSSSFKVDGMVIIPASVKTVSEVAGAYSGSLITRAADNMLKMKKRLVVCIRETPLSGPCIENMAKIAQYGGIVMPLSPGFYHRPKDIKDIYNFITGKVLDCLCVENEKFKRWDNGV